MLCANGKKEEEADPACQSRRGLHRHDADNLSDVTIMALGTTMALPPAFLTSVEKSAISKHQPDVVVSRHYVELARLGKRALPVVGPLSHFSDEGQDHFLS